MYTVIGCTDCDSVKIIREGVKSTVCNRCQTQLIRGQAEVIFSSNDLEEAKEARSVAMAQRNGFDYLVEEMVDKEVVKDNVTTEVADEELLENAKDEESAGVKEPHEAPSVAGSPTEEEISPTEEEIDNQPEKQAIGDESEDPKKRIVMDGIEFLDEPKDEDIIEFAKERGVEKEYTVEIVDKLCMNGEAMRTRDGVIKLLD